MLAVTRRQLLALARHAAARAYCPYSRFHVGAALLADDGRFFTAANVENASYGLTLCAERNAIFAAASHGVRRLRGIALACLDAADDAPPAHRTPCGACRQVMAEFGPPEMPVLIDGVGELRLDQLLPLAFVLGPATESMSRPRPRVVSRLPDAARELAADFDVGPGLTPPFALITDDPAEAHDAALAGVHAVLIGTADAGEGLCHRCADWAEVRSTLAALSSA